MLNLKQFLHDTYTLDIMEDESFDYDLADIEGVLSELPGQVEEEDEIDDIPREMLAFGTPDGLEEKVTDTQGKTQEVPLYVIQYCGFLYIPTIIIIDG
jgi:hypothetical protein